MEERYKKYRALAYRGHYTLQRWQAVPEGTTAIFHQWGTRLTEKGDLETVAIVEDNEGQVRLVNPMDIKFTDGGPLKKSWHQELEDRKHKNDGEGDS